MYESVEMAVGDRNLPLIKDLLQKGGVPLARAVRERRTFRLAIKQNDAEMMKLLLDFGCVSFNHQLIILIDLYDSSTCAINVLFKSAPELFLRCVANYSHARLSLRQLATTHLSGYNPADVPCVAENAPFDESVDDINPI